MLYKVRQRVQGNSIIQDHQNWYRLKPVRLSIRLESLGRATRLWNLRDPCGH